MKRGPYTAHEGHGAEEEYLTGDFLPSRAPCVNAKRIIVKVGTRVATLAKDERLAVGRLGALVEVIQELASQGREVILVTCGATTVGRRKLRCQQILHSTPLQYQQLSQALLAPAPCATAGQSSLMTLWDKMFHILGMACAQLLLSRHDFEDANFRSNLASTVDSLLALGIVPVLNETLVTQQHEGEDTFVDNDGLTAYAAELLSADLTLFLSNIDGVPWESGAHHTRPEDGRAEQKGHPNVISTYCPDVHGASAHIVSRQESSRGAIQDWGPVVAADDSRTRSLQSKVAAAWRCAEAGSSAVVMNGLVPELILRVCLQGAKIGTLFNKSAALQVAMRGNNAVDIMLESRNLDTALDGAVPGRAGPEGRSKPAVQSLIAVARGTRAASRELHALSGAERSRILTAIAHALEERAHDVIMANHLDVSRALAEGSQVPTAIVQRMSLNEATLANIVRGIHELAAMRDPCGEVIMRRELAQDLVLERVRVPIGVLLAIVEARPDVLPQVVALAVRSGNGVLIKGGEEVHHTNAVIFSIIASCIAQHCNAAVVNFVQTREEVEDLLQMRDEVDLVVARGSGGLVGHVRGQTRIPVLGHASGVCSVYIDADVDMRDACRVCVDSKTDYPAACNAANVVLVHRRHRELGGIFQLLSALRSAGVVVYGAPAVQTLLGVPAPPCAAHEYAGMQVTLKLVDSLEEAVAQIHAYGSGHTDVICTSSEAAADRFHKLVDSACVFSNCSTRFADGYRFGLGGEVGLSSSRIHARGPVGVHGLMTTKYVLRGRGQVVQQDTGVQYTHKELPV